MKRERDSADDADLAEHGLERCACCHRILRRFRLTKGHCKAGLGCWAAKLIADALADGHPDSILFARAIENALMEYGNLSAS